MTDVVTTSTAAPGEVVSADVPLLTPPISGEEATSGSDVTNDKTKTTTPLPSFDNLKTTAPVTANHGGNHGGNQNQQQPTFNQSLHHREPSPASITPPSSSPASTSSCMEDFLPNLNNETSAGTGDSSVTATANSDYMNLSELASHMDYNAYDYHSYRQQQISMYQNNPAEQQHHVHQQHHHQQQQQQQQHSMHQQWFSYTSSQINDASAYSYYANAGYNNFSAATNNSNSGATSTGATSNPQQDYAMGFSSNYGGYGAHHPSYCI